MSSIRAGEIGHSDNTQYTRRVNRSQFAVEPWVVGQYANRIYYGSATDFGVGKSGLMRT